jgi:hypothetical protein
LVTIPLDEANIKKIRKEAGRRSIIATIIYSPNRKNKHLILLILLKHVIIDI